MDLDGGCFLDMSIAAQSVIIELPLDQQAIDAFGPEFEDAAARAVATTRKRLQVEGKQLIPKDTGNLRRSFRVVPRGKWRLELKWTAAYAAGVDIGVPRHIIRPRDPDGFLVFPGTNAFAGQTIYTKKVDHPGQAGQFYKLDVQMLGIRILREEMQKEFSKLRLALNV